MVDFYFGKEAVYGNMEFPWASRLHTGGYDKPHQRAVCGGGTGTDPEDPYPHHAHQDGSADQTYHPGLF